MKIIEGNVTGSSSIHIGIVAARFNDAIVSRLVDGAVDGLVRHNVLEENITLVKVPGAFEIPAAAKRMAESGAYDAIICLGAVIRGQTTHYDYVCNEVSKGIAQIALAVGLPIMFGVLTTENVEQAMDRAGTKHGNKGYDCALGAIEMLNVLRQL
ncbi:MAG: 6,7-dimethyl-8-ribityllumazine synthase [Treponema sp.]|nr:6,7-dimethyl-8-ribityllumazine synthase [Treponema sp.]